MGMCYECARCGFQTPRLSTYDNHTHRKILCRPLVSAVHPDKVNMVVRKTLTTGEEKIVLNATADGPRTPSCTPSRMLPTTINNDNTNNSTNNNDTRRHDAHARVHGTLRPHLEQDG